MENIKEKFEKMCGYINVDEKGLFFPYIVIDLVEELNSFKQDSDYPILKQKMDNLIKLVNSDSSVLDKDISEEIWDMI
jgi:hypothetical protein